MITRLRTVGLDHAPKMLATLMNEVKPKMEAADYKKLMGVRDPETNHGIISHLYNQAAGTINKFKLNSSTQAEDFPSHATSLT